MEEKNNDYRQAQKQNSKFIRVKRYIKFLSIISVSILLMGCWIAELWVDMSDSNFWQNDEVQIVGDQEQIKENSEQKSPNDSASLSEAPNQPGEPQSSKEITNNVGMNEYSVSAQDFNCICQVNGNVNIELRVNENKLEIIHPNGEVEMFEKIGENTYKKTWMGYYIDTTGGKETKVDEERSAIIILNNNGYILEHYQGSESSPCCIYTYTKLN
jgi:hypothetical protein